MKLNALLVSRDCPSLRVLGALLDVMQIEQQTCHSSGEAVELLVQGHYSALVMDFDLPGAGQVARMARMASAKREPVVFAMVSAFTPVGGEFPSVVNFVLYKPLAYEQVARSLHAGQRYMKPNPRHAPRHPLEALVYLRFGAKALPAMVLDLSEQGLALQAPEPLPPVENVPLRFVLPGTSDLVEATGKVIWTEDDGRAGMFFSQLTAASRHHLKNWLAKRGAKSKNAVRVLLPPQRSRRGAHPAH
ncbi:MAG TPA: PilZ domain-containing protein [Terriglobales bacterium]|nr:PilZ domain-containing protein [Terriglobales bacterium]